MLPFAVLRRSVVFFAAPPAEALPSPSLSAAKSKNSSPFDSMVCALLPSLFCTREKLISFPFSRLRTLATKHPGACPPDLWRVTHRVSRMLLHRHFVSSLSPLQSALTDELRVLSEVGRKAALASRLESALTDTPPVTPLESALTKKRGEGAGALGTPISRLARTPTDRPVPGLAHLSSGPISFASPLRHTFLRLYLSPSHRTCPASVGGCDG